MPTPATNNAIYSGTLSRNQNSPVIPLRCNGWIRIAASKPITVRFGPDETLAASPATAADVYYPAGSEVVQYDLGTERDGLSIFSFENGTVVSVNEQVR